MEINLPGALRITTSDPVDTRLVLTKAEMKTAIEARMPDVYFTICKDDGKLYLYNKNNDISAETGKFRALAEGEEVNAYKSIAKIKDYLYELHYTDLDYEYANNWFKNSNDLSKFGACSSFRNGNWYGRNYDWVYNNQVDFIIKTPRMNNKFASIGMGGNVAELTESVVASGAYNETYKILPFKLLAGINEYGVFANTNVVPTQYGETTGTVPLIEQKLELCNIALPRFILDNFKSAQEAVDYIKNYVSVYCYNPLYTYYNEDIHVMIGDKEKTFIMEFVQNEVVVREVPIMTNFFVHNVVFNEDGSVYTPEMYNVNNAHDPVSVNKITTHGNGLERYNLINETLATTNSKESARQLLTKLFYTNAYKDNEPVWYSELAGGEGSTEITLNSPMSTLEAGHALMKDQFARRSRDTGETWHTIHSCVFDLEHMKFYLVAQEDLTDEIEVDFGYYTVPQVNELLKNIDISEDNLAIKLPGALKIALAKQGSDSGLAVDENGNISVQLNEDHLQIIDNKIDLALELIQAIGPEV